MVANLSTATHSFISAMNKKRAQQDWELRFKEFRSYPLSFGTEGALKEMEVWIDNPDPDVRAFATQKLAGADQSCGYYDEMFRIMLNVVSHGLSQRDSWVEGL